MDASASPAAEIASAWEAVTEAFGEVQDTVVSAEVLGRHAWAAELAGEPVRPYTLLWRANSTAGWSRCGAASRRSTTPWRWARSCPT